MKRAFEKRSQRTPFYQMTLTFLIFLAVSVIECEKVARNTSQVSVCDDGKVSRHFYLLSRLYVCLLGILKRFYSHKELKRNLNV